jgi:hypothetical protein
MKINRQLTTEVMGRVFFHTEIMFKEEYTDN